MAEPEQPAQFLGDLDDPWVRAIAGSLPPRTVRRHHAGSLTDDAVRLDAEPACYIVHRSVLTPGDMARLEALGRTRAEGGKLILCLGPYVRYAEVERLTGFVDLIISEATAADTVARHLPGWRRDRPPAARPRISVVGASFELGHALADLIRSTGHEAGPVGAWSQAPAPGVAVWNVPLLEPGWAEELARESRTRRVLALMAFADRDSVAMARSSGASACLELPCDRDDLAFVLDRLTEPIRGSDPAHQVPPPPLAPRRARPSSALAEPRLGS